MVDEDVALAHRGEDVGLLALLGSQPRLIDGRERRVAQLREAGQLDDLPQVGQVEQPVDVEDLARLDLERLHQLVAPGGVHPPPDLDAHDLAEAPAPQLVLDGLEQVVGLVGDGEVRVAGDPEHVVVEDLHAREERRGGARSRPRFRRRCARPRRPAWKRGSISFGTFTRARPPPRSRDRAATRRARARGSRCRERRPTPTASGVSTG